jgi:hypothetical protein
MPPGDRRGKDSHPGTSADADFRIVGFPNSYMLNLKTTGLARGTYNLLFTVGTDPVVYSTPFQIR